MLSLAFRVNYGWLQTACPRSTIVITAPVKCTSFNRTFTAEEQDKELISKLSAELPGILNWAIEGCRAWQQEGLAPPTIIEDQIAEYRSSMDSISQFVQDECELAVDHSCSASQFYNAYRTWCLTVGKKPKTTTAFKKSLDQIPTVYQKRTSSGQCWFGIRPCFVG
ncbi:primase-like DNA-binding domain-containing protein [Lentibacter sp.]|uniref:primase-like DNA-binding domain-containing protein n=1 Tax=Lentibacter sp. TaxID=2024994 RepID=UPI003F6988FE